MATGLIIAFNTLKMVRRRTANFPLDPFSWIYVHQPSIRISERDYYVGLHFASVEDLPVSTHHV